MQIFLIGFMGSGKTRTARNLSKRMSMPYLDLDQFIEDKAGRSVRAIFREDGEEKFREIEREALQDIIVKNENLIVATGGGTPIFYNNIEMMKEEGLVVYLDVLPEVIFQRVKDKVEERPLLKSLRGESLLNNIKDLLAKREKYYLQAHLAVEISTMEFDAAMEIAGYLERVMPELKKNGGKFPF